ncbi:protein-disulfide reductase DsbD domain-containing protein, partial [Thiocapsa sp.]|uniref:protein-disulfide reductase DsbD domain-containing protein n=1 Tax=Thiocapsa sp. TaxID=2024551 RepID=UPI003592F64C
RLALLLDQALRRDDHAALTAAVFTLQSMARGGIHDQVGGGFHRYAIDNDWLVPHFEKMLYDQAQLARLYLAGWRLTGDPELARVVRRTLDFVLRDLTSPAGGFYSATDAESEGEEGLFFLWTPAELRSVLSAEDAELAIALYGVTESGNFEERNILHLPSAPESFAAARGLSSAELWQRMDAINQRLYRHREGRPHPHRDEKILTAWNGMMIAALAEAADALGEPRYLSAAERAAELLWSEQRPAPGRINRVYLDGRTAQPGLLEDYAFLGQAMIALYDATGEQRWLTRAREMVDALWERFADHGEGGLFMGEAAEATPLMTRPKDLTDGVMPSATSAALQLLAELTRRTDELAYERHASALSASTSGLIARAPSAFPSLLAALNLMRHGDTGHLQYGARGAVRADARISARNNPGDDGRASLVIDLTLRPGWHVNAHRPLQDELIGTTLRISGESGDWQMAAPAYPTPEILRLGFQSEPLAVYQGQVRIAATLAENPQQRADPGEDPSGWLPFELRLQACSDAICLAPETLVLQVPLSFLSR